MIDDRLMPTQSTVIQTIVCKYDRNRRAYPIREAFQVPGDVRGMAVRLEGRSASEKACYDFPARLHRYELSWTNR